MLSKPTANRWSEPNSASLQQTQGASVRTYERDRQALEKFTKAQEELHKYAFASNGRIRPNGSRQYYTAKQDKGRATLAQHRSKAARQATVLIPADVQPKIRQRLRWGSPQWIAEWSRRQSVESGYGNLKSVHGENLKRGAFCVVGLVRTTLMVTFAAIHYNLRMLRKWAAASGRQSDHALLKPDEQILGYEAVPLTATAPATGPPQNN